MSLKSMRYFLILVLLGLLTTKTLSKPPPVININESESDKTEYDDEADGEVADALDEEESENRDESSVDEQEEDDSQSIRAREPSNTYRQQADATTIKNENNVAYKSNIESEDLQNEYQPPEKYQAGGYTNKNVNEPESARFANHADDPNKDVQDEVSTMDKRTATSQEGALGESEVLYESKETARHREISNKGDSFRPRDASPQFSFSKRMYNSISKSNSAPDGDPSNQGYSKEIDYSRNRRAAQFNNSEELGSNEQSMKSSYDALNDNNAAVDASNSFNMAKADYVAADAVISDSAVIDNMSDTVNNDAVDFTNTDGGNPGNADNSVKSAEDEEEAIKRHIKTLSSKELEELLNSLSTDKKQLLKKIMDSDIETNNNIDKREITKKSGAAPDDNSLAEGGQPENVKLQDAINIELHQIKPNSELSSDEKMSSSSSTEITTAPSASNSTDTISSTLLPERLTSPTTLDSKKEKSNDDTMNFDNVAKMDTIKIDTNNQPEVNFNDVEPNHIKSKTKRENKNGQTMKREALSDLNNYDYDSINSLKDSFPNSNSYDDDDPYAGSDMAPLVRVKRKNTDMSMKKRSANIVSDAVAFVPYRAENEDEDSEEGNEFDDDSINDPTANLAKTNLNVESGNRYNFGDVQAQLDHKETYSNQPLKQRDVADLGSDTDSGIEATDDNFMLNGPQNIHNDEKPYSRGDDQSEINTITKQNRHIRSTVADEDAVAVSQKYESPNYHENDAFGSLPRNYEGDLSRYKRIRRVKELLPDSQHFQSKT